ncbi:hypothetical protein [Methylobacterium sp. WCS2018Hpa-22]|uniref:hypothetical protein n=1 Tax=Methylobacterium sp. WCS2018Hpa-22 TaxID=3073633 RepID=UPI00288927B8|nr:hypothetical protein [Methylobacterium sp. WCS2018Hpa-22]
MDQAIDIPVSRPRSVGMFVIALCFTVGCASILYARPGIHGHAFEPGSFHTFLIWFGLFFFGVASVVSAPRMFRSGTLVSVGRQGIFDRRLSSGWIPWDAVEDLKPIMRGRQRYFVLRVDPERSGELPIFKGRRRMAPFTGLGAYGYAIGGADLQGGFAALGDALSGTALWRAPSGTGTR